MRLDNGSDLDAHFAPIRLAKPAEIRAVEQAIAGHPSLKEDKNHGPAL